MFFTRTSHREESLNKNLSELDAIRKKKRRKEGKSVVFPVILDDTMQSRICYKASLTNELPASPYTSSPTRSPQQNVLISERWGGASELLFLSWCTYSTRPYIHIRA